MRRVKIAMVKILPSKELRITTYSADDARYLMSDGSWVRELGAEALVKIPLFGVVLNKIYGKSMDLKKEDMITRMTAENTQWPGCEDLEINDIQHLKPGTENNKVISIVVLFKNPVQAETARVRGLIWNCEKFTATRFDRSLTMRYCLRCSKYGHIGTVCHEQERCGFCSGEHRTNDRTRKINGGKSTCPNCKGRHLAWAAK